MILYHFTAAHLVPQIMQEGLTLGVFPVFENGEVKFIENCIWLTIERDRTKQSWATKNIIDYDRTEYRLTIDIPKTRWKKLIKATEYIKYLPEESKKIVNEWQGSEKWYLYIGKIPPKWIVGCKNLKGG